MTIFISCHSELWKNTAAVSKELAQIPPPPSPFMSSLLTICHSLQAMQYDRLEQVANLYTHYPNRFIHRHYCSGKRCYQKFHFKIVFILKDFQKTVLISFKISGVSQIKTCIKCGHILGFLQVRT